MESWIRERAIKAHEEKQKANEEKLDTLFKRLMWEIVGIDIGYTECHRYQLREYSFCLHDPSSSYNICPDTANLYVSYRCPYISYHSNFSPCLGRALNDAADWGHFILSCERHYKYCEEEGNARREREGLLDRKKKGWFGR